MSSHLGQVRETFMCSTMEERRESGFGSTSFAATDVSASAASSSCSEYLTARNESIEESKVHWSDLSEVDPDLTDDQIAADNREVFKSLQAHPVWGNMFFTFNQDEECPSLVVGEKIAEGAQAEIFNAFVDWHISSDIETRFKWEVENVKHVLKVFKKGTMLRHLQSQLSYGYFEWLVKDFENEEFIRTEPVVRNLFGTLLPNGQFAILMHKEDEDLRSLIVGKNGKYGDDCGPFEKEEVIEFMHHIALGLYWLHKQNVIHRDVKSSNILVSNGYCYVGDYDCSIGVIGTGFWRDPQILQACKERNVSHRPEIFTRAADVYAYAMTCYEIVTGKLPFEGEVVTMDLVIEGQQPRVPDYVDKWIHELLCLCWHSDRALRPSFEEICNTIAANFTSPLLKAIHDWRMKEGDEGLKPILGCINLSHGLEMLEIAPYDCGVFTCNLCLKKGDGAVYHCSSCGDFDLHPECATISPTISSFMHPHDMLLLPRFMLNGEERFCNACGLDIIEDIHRYTFYQCPIGECDFHLHTHCANYVRTISHYLHEEHELELITRSTMVETTKSWPVCYSCNIQLDPLEIVYCCRECEFNIHPHCTIGKLECKPWY